MLRLLLFFITAIKAGNFNYIIVQEGFTSDYTIGGASEKDPSFGINSYKYLTHQLSLPKVSGNSNEVTKPFAYTIPANTKIMIDPLAGPNSAVPTTNTIWNVCNGLTCPNTLWANLNDSYIQLKDQ
jgi:hypothetical protein